MVSLQKIYLILISHHQTGDTSLINYYFIMKTNLEKPLWQLSTKEFMELLSGDGSKSPEKTNGRTVRGLNNRAAELGVSTPTVNKWKKQGKIPYSQLGRIIHFDLDQVQQALHGSRKEEIL